MNAVQLSDEPAEFRLQTHPTVGGAVVSSVLVDGSLAATNRHILLTGDVADALNEQVRLQFDPALNVRQVDLLLVVEPRIVTAIGGTAAAVLLTHEARALRATFNPVTGGDDRQAAIRLSNGYPDVLSTPPGMRLTLKSNSPITDVYWVVALTDQTNPTPLRGLARVHAEGYSFN